METVVTRSVLPKRRQLSLRAALLGALAVMACSFQDFDYLKDGKSGAPGAATGGRNPLDYDAGYAGYEPWQDAGRAGRRPGWAGAPGVGGNAPAGGGSTGGAPTAPTGGTTDSAGAAGA
jgi:hypothetical protein